MKNYNSVKLLILITSFNFLIINYGCGVKTTSSSLLNKELSESNQKTDIKSETTPLIDTTDTKIPVLNCERGDSIIEAAVIECLDSNFAFAHKLIDSALTFLELIEDDPNSNCHNSDMILSRTAELYLSYFPPNYLDSIPQDISGLIFKSQFAIYDDYNDKDDTISNHKVSMECDEGIPYNISIERNERVEKALYKVAVKRARGINNLLNRAAFYLPVMKSVFKEKNLPTDLVYLPLLESGFKPKAYSYAHASGIWQFIPSTGRIFGLRNNYWLDERRDPLKSTVAAAEYLEKLYKDFNDWHLALAAYNCGERRVERAIKKAQSNNYWDLKLPTQTMHYVPLYMAYQMVGKNPQCFGFATSNSEIFDFDTVKISDCLDMKKIAKAINVNHEELKRINPHIKRWCTPPETKNVTLYLPKGKVESYKNYYKTLTDTDKVKWYRYRIRSGDNLGSIAGRFHTNIPAIKSINNMKSNRIIAGRHLFIPIPADGTVPREQKPKIKLVHSEPIEAAKFRKQGLKPTRYILKKGDTMSELAEIFNVSVSDIKRWNNIRNPKRLRAGTTLKFYIKPDKSHPAYLKNVVKKQNRYPDTTGLKRVTYRVVNGDNFYNISKKLGVNMNDLIIWNDKNINHPIIHAGEILKYYKTSSAIKKTADNGANFTRYRIQSGDNLYSLSDLFNVDLNRLLKLNNLSLNSVIRPGDIIKIPARRGHNPINSSNNNNYYVYYKVKTGDNFWEISRQFGVSLQSIYDANGFNSRSILRPGDIIKINKPKRS